MKIRDHFLSQKAKGIKSLAVLLDPDAFPANKETLIKLCQSPVDYFFIGGSLASSFDTTSMIRLIRQNSNVPTILFPGSALQLSAEADALLFLSLLSGRNPDLLIGKQVESAPMVRNMGIGGSSDSISPYRWWPTNNGKLCLEYEPNSRR